MTDRQIVDSFDSWYTIADHISFALNSVQILSMNTQEQKRCQLISDHLLEAFKLSKEAYMAYRDGTKMTLDEAIQHALDVAKKSCGHCAEMHSQLAGWLIELKTLRREANDD